MFHVARVKGISGSPDSVALPCLQENKTATRKVPDAVFRQGNAQEKVR
jgi:hypothetical protein